MSSVFWGEEGKLQRDCPKFMFPVACSGNPIINNII